MSRQVQLRKIVGRQIAKKRKEAGLTQEAMGPLVHLVPKATHGTNEVRQSLTSCS